MIATDSSTDQIVRHFRQILLWPIQLMPIGDVGAVQKHWELLQRTEPGNPWRELADEFTGDSRDFQERHYSEFVTFLRMCSGSFMVRAQAAMRTYARNRASVFFVATTWPRRASDSLNLVLSQ